MTRERVAWVEEGQWTAHSPSMPGVYGVGETSAAAVADLEEALAELDSYLDEIGERRR
jgi:predicted RNase H-like HicB family nuclease